MGKSGRFSTTLVDERKKSRQEGRNSARSTDGAANASDDDFVSAVWVSIGRYIRHASANPIVVNRLGYVCIRLISWKIKFVANSAACARSPVIPHLFVLNVVFLRIDHGAAAAEHIRT